MLSCGRALEHVVLHLWQRRRPTAGMAGACEVAQGLPTGYLWPVMGSTEFAELSANAEQLLRTVTRYPACCAAQQLPRAVAGSCMGCPIARGAAGQACPVGSTRPRVTVHACRLCHVSTRRHASLLRNEKFQVVPSRPGKSQGTTRTFVLWLVGCLHKVHKIPARVPILGRHNYEEQKWKYTTVRKLNLPLIPPKDRGVSLYVRVPR